MNDKWSLRLALAELKNAHLLRKEDFTLQNMETNWTWTEPIPSSCSKVEVVQSTRSRIENLTSKNSVNILLLLFEPLTRYLLSHCETVWIRATANCLKCEWAKNCKQGCPELMLVEGLLIERLLFYPRISESISATLLLLPLGGTTGGADYIMQLHNLISAADANLNTNNVCLSGIRWKNYRHQRGGVPSQFNPPPLSSQFISGHRHLDCFKPGVIRWEKKPNKSGQQLATVSATQAHTDSTQSWKASAIPLLSVNVSPEGLLY